MRVMGIGSPTALNGAGAAVLDAAPGRVRERVRRAPFGVSLELG